MTRERARQLWNGIAESMEVNGAAIVPPRVRDELAEAGFLRGEAQAGDVQAHGIDLEALDSFAWGDEHGSPLRLWLRRHKAGQNQADLARLELSDPWGILDSPCWRNPPPAEAPPDDESRAFYDGLPYEDDPSHPLSFSNRPEPAPFSADTIRAAIDELTGLGAAWERYPAPRYPVCPGCASGLPLVDVGDGYMGHRVDEATTIACGHVVLGGKGAIP
jgi:hypothetical protein